MDGTETARATARRVAGTVLALALSPALAACGGDEPAPSEQVPALSDQLEEVDDAVAAGDPAGTREAVEALVAQVAQAQVGGELSDEQAQRIIAAARSVLEALAAGESGDEG